MTPVKVRAQLTDALRLDLVGPGEVLGAAGRVLGDAGEILPQRPSTWYLTGFLVPLNADPEQKIDEQGTDELDEVSDAQGVSPISVSTSAATSKCALIRPSIKRSICTTSPDSSANVGSIFHF